MTLPKLGLLCLSGKMKNYCFKCWTLVNIYVNLVNLHPKELFQGMLTDITTVPNGPVGYEIKCHKCLTTLFSSMKLQHKKGPAETYWILYDDDLTFTC